MRVFENIRNKVKFYIAGVMRSRRMIGDWFFDKYGWRDYEYQTYDYYGNFKVKRVWKLRILGREFTRDYDDDFA